MLHRATRCAHSLAFVTALAAAVPVNAQSPGTPENWPCVQRYAPELSAGSFWPYELPDDEQWRQNQRIANLAKDLSKRTTPLTEHVAKLKKFFGAIAAPRRRATAAELTSALLDAMNSERKRIVKGIHRFSYRQQQMLGQIDELAIQIDKLVNADASGKQLFDLRETQDAQVRTFDEREAMIGYLCQQPVLLERRFFTLGREITALAEEP